MSAESISMIRDLIKPTEANIIGCFYDNPDLFYDHNYLTMDDFQNPIWKLYFAIGKKMALNGVKVFTEADLMIFLNKNGDNKQLLDKYNEFGGYKSIEFLQGLFNKENIDVYIDELRKWSAAVSIIKTLNFTPDSISRVRDLDINQLYDYYNAQFNNIFINVKEDVITSKLDDDIDHIINEADKGMTKGLPIPSEILSRTINGITRGQIILIGGQSGSGKTTFLIQSILVSVFEHEEPAVFFLNEQDNVKFKTEMLTWIINNKIRKENDEPFNKTRWRDGHFTDEEKSLLSQASQILKDKVKNNKIIIVEFKTYTHSTVVRSIKKYSSMGVKIFAIDTFKLSSDADNNQPFWLAMQNQMKELDDLVKPSNLNVSLICTLQLGKDAILSRYLSANSIGMSRGVIDVASVCLLIRKMHSDEYEGGKNALEVVKPIAGTSSGQVVKPKNGKRHSIIFIAKNRNGAAEEEQIVARHELGTLRYEELGVTNIPFGT